MKKSDKPYHRSDNRGSLIPTRHMKRSDNLIFLVCIIIAAFFWLLIKLADTYIVSYNYSITYRNIPVEKKLTKIIDTTLNISFKARGFDILRLNITESKEKMTLDLKDYKIENIKNDKYYISTGLIKEELANYVNISESDIELSKNTLQFILDELHEKEVKVKGRHLIEFKDQFDLYEKELLSPQTVSVFGPLSVLDTLHFIYTEEIKLSNIYKDQSVKVRLYNPLPELLNLEPEIVTVQLRVERFTESFIETDIDLSELPEKIRTFPSTIRINFKVAQKDFSNVQPKQFRIVPEIENIDLSEAKRLHLKIVEKPVFIRNEWIVPSDVEFLILK